MDDIDWGLEEDLAREMSSVGSHDDELPYVWSAPSSNPWSTCYTPGELNQLQGYDVPHPAPEGRKHEEQGVQTDAWTAEKEVNTDQDWESLMQSMEEYSTHLALKYEVLLKQQQDEEAEHGSHADSLEQKKEERIRQQQVLLDKIESLRVKLQLNCCKTTRKNFAVKKQELSAEKGRMEEEKNKLSQELEETTRKLTLLIEEQNQEKQTWEQELTELNTEMERLQKETEEASQAALRDEIAALEMQRDVTMSEVEDWLKEAERYLYTLRLDPYQQHIQKRLEWERNEARVRSSVMGLQNQFKEHLHLLQQGHPLESLPGVTHLPHLPQIPTVELVMNPVMYPPTRPPFQQFQMGPPNSMGMPFLPQHQQSFTAPIRVTPSPAPSPTPPASPLPPHPATQPASQPPTMPTAQPLPPSNPQPAGKLDKLLEKLGARFPQCTRAQLMSVLQQIKTSRGTMAGMSMEEVTQQVAQRLAQSERQAPGPIRPPSSARGFSGQPTPIQRPPGPIQRPTHSPQRPAVAQVFHTRPPQPVAPSNRKLCLMCQNHVEADSQHPMSCTHTVHKECISVWLQSSKNNSCPFCPAK